MTPGLSHNRLRLSISRPCFLLTTGPAVRVGDDDDEYNTKYSATAQKRVKAVQLLFVGVLGLMLAALGNFLIGTSCHYVSVPVQAGQYQESFPLHFGLWKYSPADSAMSGYSYCYPYNGSHDDEAPVVSRIANIVALVLGTYTLVVLWFYLITGKANRTLWGLGVWTALLAAAAHMTTLYFFFDTLCQTRQCSWGPASFLTVGTSVAWIILAFELHYQGPLNDKNATNLDNLEMADLASASVDYMDRFSSTKPTVSYNPPNLED